MENKDKIQARGDVSIKQRLVAELAEVLGDKKKWLTAGVRIDNLAEDLDPKVKELLEDGIREFGRLGILIGGFSYDKEYGVYEDSKRKEKVWNISEGTKEEGQLVVQVRENTISGERSLTIGMIRDLGGEHKGLTASVLLDYGYSGTEVAEISTLDLLVYSLRDRGVFYGEEYGEKTGELWRTMTDKRPVPAEAVFKKIFKSQEQHFFPAMSGLFHFQQKKFGWLGE